MNTSPQILHEDSMTDRKALQQAANTTPDFFYYDKLSDNTPNLGFLVPNEFVILFCQQGSLTLTVNHSQDYTLGQGDLLISLPRTSLEDFTPSNDLQLWGLCLAPSTINDSLLADNTLWPNIEFLSSHPMIHLTEEEIEVGRHFHQLYQIYSRREKTKFKSYIIHDLHKLIVYQIADMISARMQDVPKSTQYSQTDTTFKRFLHLLAISQGKMRNVAYFARELCITTKYLSHIVKEKTGHSAKQLIDETVATEIRHQLCYTSKTVKEIANDLNFPSLSFFGTYTRKHLNASPANIRKEYRARK